MCRFLHDSTPDADYSGRGLGDALRPLEVSGRGARQDVRRTSRHLGIGYTTCTGMFRQPVRRARLGGWGLPRVICVRPC
jgi:hypothetical protein